MTVYTSHYLLGTIPFEMVAYELFHSPPMGPFPGLLRFHLPLSKLELYLLVKRIYHHFLDHKTTIYFLIGLLIQSFKDFGRKGVLEKYFLHLQRINYITSIEGFQLGK